MYSSIFTSLNTPNVYFELLHPVHGIDTVTVFFSAVNNIWLDSIPSIYQLNDLNGIIPNSSQFYV